MPPPKHRWMLWLTRSWQSKDIIENGYRTKYGAIAFFIIQNALDKARIIGQAEKIVGACTIVKGKSDQYVRGHITLAHLIIGVTDLCAFQISGKIFLKQVVIFP